MELRELALMLPNYAGLIIALYVLLKNNRDLHRRVDSLEEKLDKYFFRDD